MRARGLTLPVTGMMVLAACLAGCVGGEEPQESTEDDFLDGGDAAAPPQESTAPPAEDVPQGDGIEFTGARVIDEGTTSADAPPGPGRGPVPARARRAQARPAARRRMWCPRR